MGNSKEVLAELDLLSSSGIASSLFRATAPGLYAESLSPGITSGVKYNVRLLDMEESASKLRSLGTDVGGVENPPTLNRVDDVDDRGFPNLALLTADCLREASRRRCNLRIFHLLNASWITTTAARFFSNSRRPDNPRKNRIMMAAALFLFSTHFRTVTAR